MTTVYSNEYTHGLWRMRLKCDYTVTSTNTATTINASVVLQYKADSAETDTDGYYQFFAQLTNNAKVSSAMTHATIKGTSWQTYSTTVTTSKTYTRSTANQTISLNFWGTAGWTSDNQNTSSETKTVSITVPVLQSYNVSYNANGGSGAPSQQTKYYGKTLTLSSTKPTRANCTFQKWNTVSGGTGTNYSPGGSYTANAAATLYAQWKYNHTAPTITSLVVKRCDSDGTDNEEGESCKVEAAYEIDTKVVSTAKIASYTVKVGSNAAVTTTVSDGTSSGTISYVYNSSTLSIANPYNVTLTVTDDVTDVISGTVGYSSSRTSVLSRSFFTMDFLSGGRGVGIGKAATETNLLDVAMETRFNALATAQGTTSSSVAYGSTNPRFRFSNADASQNGELVFTDYDAIHAGATLAWITDQTQSWFHTQHIQATGSITSGGTIMAGQNEHITSTAINDASVATSSNTDITNRLDYAGNGTQVGYSQIMRTSTGMYRSFAVTNPKASKTTALYLHSNDDGTQSFSANVPLGASSGGTGRAMSTANRTYWCGRALYSNNTGTTGTVTLSETAANFTFMFIGFKENDGYYDGMFVYGPNGKTVALTTAESTVNTAVNTKWRTVSISGTSMTTVHYSDNGSASNHIYITHVIGFA